MPAPVAFALAYLCSGKDLQTFTGKFQVILVIISGTLLGVSLDFPFEHFPFFTISALLCVVAQVTRISFFPFFTQTRFKFFEPIFWILAVVLFFAKNLFSNENIYQWIIQAVQLTPTGIFVIGLYFDIGGLVKKVKKGYGVDIGKNAPDFALPDVEGNIVKLSELIGQRNLLLIFVRGDWCPWCHMMLRTYQKNIERFKEKNILLLAIGPDTMEVNRDMVVKLGLEYKLLADEKQRIASQYGCQIAHEEDTNLMSTNPVFERYEEGIPLPASFLLDKNGIVRYISKAEKVGEFLDPASIFPILEKME